MIRPYDVERSFDVYLSFMKEIFEVSGRSDADFSAFAQGYRARITAWSRRPDTFLKELYVENLIAGIIEAAFNSSGTAQISTLYIAPQFRGQGFAQSLESAALEFFRSLGHLRVILNVAAANTRAIAYYRKNNWEECLESQYPNSLQFEKAIGAGASF